MSEENEVQGRGRLMAERYRRVRQFTEMLCEPLEVEDYVVQSMPDASPAKWHLAHTTWFFETFVLGAQPDFRAYHPQYSYLFNSYYNAVGDQFSRPRRGLLSRPSVKEIYDYRAAVDAQVAPVLTSAAADDALLDVVELGLHHEQQHQELLLTDLKHMFAANPMCPVYFVANETGGRGVSGRELEYLKVDEGVYHVGDEGDHFAYDNERPRHRVFLESFEIASRPVTNGEYLEFMEDGGYEDPMLWLSEGWDTIRREGWKAPLYWEKRGDQWLYFTLSGMRPVIPNEPVCHVSYYEADAFARWAGARLPTEQEWEVAAASRPIAGNFAESRRFHPAAEFARPEQRSAQFYGDVWEWTASQYSPYPGYAPPAGALGEYNGKFMCNQFVLRGGSCATSVSHIRATYRNFFHPSKRWQFSGFRLAR